MSNARRTVSVAVEPKPYEVLVQPGLLHDVGMLLSRLSGSKKACIITDRNVGPMYAASLAAGMANAGIRGCMSVLTPGEDHKTLADLLPVYNELLSQKLDRHTPLIALGGGVVGDMAGFVAATLLRGVPFIQVPTTLLSMVDASVGGKTGVNAPAGKNLIGAFHQPLAVLIDPNVLASLSTREFASGLAECIKHEIIRDADGFAALEHNLAKALGRDVDFLSALIAHNVAIKARVVEADPFERGERAHLNFGHTFGHAIEKLSNFSYTHGEAVALGMTAAARLSAALGMLDEPSVGRIERLIAAAGLPIGGMTLATGDVVDAMGYDKKADAGKIRFVLPTRIGAATVRDDVPPDAVLTAVDSLRG